MKPKHTSPPAVRVRGLRKRFGYRETLRGVDLTITAGTCFGIFGPNGAGKSTVLRILATQWTYSSGSVEVLGHDLRREPHLARRHLGVVFHDSFLRRELTLEENLHLGCDLYGLDYGEVRSRIDGLLERLHLHSRKGERVSTYSQGMMKRASIVRSLIHDPSLWILDEPFSGLDTSGQELLEESIRAFHKAGGTVILVTHGEERGQRLSQTWARLENGIVVRTSDRTGTDGADVEVRQ